MLKIIFILLIAILGLKYTLFWSYVWQLKEYRTDRFRDFLVSKEGKNVFLNKFYLAKIFIFSAGIFLPLVLFLYSAIVVLAFEGAIFLKKFLIGNIIKPVFTKKAVLIVSLSFFIFLSVINIFYNYEIYLLLALLLVALFAAIANLIIYPFSYFAKERRIKFAGEKVKNFKGTVIGITGSYGKSSVKEVVSGILGDKFNVIKTPKNVNTEIGVANFILSQKFIKSIKSIKSKVEGQKLFFICEMGAYRIGEIEKLCKMIKPNIGILTGINEQHIALFGSIENTIKAKSELINFLPRGGLAILNYDDENVRKVKVPEGIRKITYGIRGLDVDSNADVNAEIQNNEGSMQIDFLVRYKNEKQAMKLCAIGRHNIQNLLPAIIIARETCMELEEIAQYIEKLEMPENAMKIKKEGDSIIIDDTYNSNPAGVKAALEVLDSFENKNKILVLDDIWELGKEGKRIHKEIAQIIARKKYAKIILVGKEYGEFMKDVIVKNGIDENKIYVSSAQGRAGSLDPAGGAILFEGRRAGKYMKF